MSKTKFTKGEWVVDTCGSRVSVWSEDESIIESMHYNYPMQEDEDRVMANAHLIAAAPDMYKFIEGLQLSVAGEVERDELLKKARGE